MMEKNKQRKKLRNTRRTIIYVPTHIVHVICVPRAQSREINTKENNDNLRTMGTCTSHSSFLFIIIITYKASRNNKTTRAVSDPYGLHPSAITDSIYIYVLLRSSSRRRDYDSYIYMYTDWPTTRLFLESFSRR